MKNILIAMSFVLTSLSFAEPEFLGSSDSLQDTSYTCTYLGSNICPAGKLCATVLYSVEGTGSSIPEGIQDAFNNCRAQYELCRYDGCRLN